MPTTSAPGRLDDAFDDANTKQRLVDWVFDSVADRYDLGNDIMSLGWHRTWKRRLVQDYLPDSTNAHAPSRVLDIACGTGDVTWLLAERYPAAEIIGADVNTQMMALAEAKRPTVGASHVRFIEATAESLPYPDGHFDLVTCVYAGRGLPDLPAYAREVFRVLRPGGRLWHLDFARPQPAWWDRTVRGWMTASGAALGLALHGHPKTYTYIPASLRRYKGQRWLDGVLAGAGFRTRLIETRGCLMAYNEGIKPE